MVFRINNRDGRRLWLHSQGLGSAPTGALDVLAIIKELGFVQLDTIRNVSRAHHHILWSRNQNYREPMLDKLLGKDRLVFEHYTHDASVLPMEFYPMWQNQTNWQQPQPNIYYTRVILTSNFTRVKYDYYEKKQTKTTHLYRLPKRTHVDHRSGLGSRHCP